METITRIHIARVAYNIEVAAHAKLERYLNAVKRGLDDDTAEEVINDIELRITELLAERNVNEGDVITTADVRFIEEQLGTPDQFVEEAEGETNRAGQPRRLLRDTDNALLGGVASGLGLYFDIDPLIFRLVFVALALLGGLGVLLYLLLWVLVPAASSNAEKLQMQGKAVTAATLQNYRQTMSRTLRNSGTASGRIILKTLKITATVIASLTLLSIATSVAVATSALFTQPLRSLVWNYHTNAIALAAVWLFALSLIVLLVLFMRQIWQRTSSTARRVTFLSTLAALVISMTTMAGLAPIIANHYNSLYGNGKTATALAVSGVTSNVTAFNISGDSTLRVTYVPSDQPLHATYQAMPGMRRPDISLKASGSTLTLNASNLHRAVPDCLVQTVCNDLYLPVRITVYGPSNLQSIAGSGGAYVTVSNAADLSPAVSVSASNGTVLTLENGSFSSLTLNASDDGTILASSTSTQNAIFTADSTSTIIAPVATNIIATVPDGNRTCNSEDVQQIITTAGVPATVVVNGKPVTDHLDTLTGLGLGCSGQSFPR